MEKNKKDLKALSLVILFLAALTLVRIVVNVCVNGLPKVELEGVTPEVTNIVAIVALALSCVLLLPQVYVGVKGLKIANGGQGNKWHIVIAIILAICSLTAVVSSAISMFKSFNFDTSLTVVDHFLDVAIFIMYIITARKIAKG